MSSLGIATDPRRFARGAPLRSLPQQYADDGRYAGGRYEALTEAEANELAARMLDANSEPEFDHLLAATISHAAGSAGGVLTPAIGRALGGLLKSVARQSRIDREIGQTLGLELEGLESLEREFETNLQFVRLAGEAARHAATEAIAARPDHAALAALAAAAEIYAPKLLTSPEEEGEFAAAFTPEIERFEYEPEMEYFLGGLIRSAARIVNKAANVVGRVPVLGDVARGALTAARDVARTVNKAANTVGRIPVLGDIARGALGAARLGLGSTAMLIDAGSRLARGENLGAALKGAVMGQVDAVRDQLKLAEMVAPFVPGIGSGVAAALGAANALAAGRPITEAILSAARSALPGGAVAQAAFDTALNLAKGKNIGESLLAAARDRLPGGPAARAAFDGAVALAQGKRLQDAAFAAAGRILPPSPFAADALAFVKGVTNGQNVQSAALSVLGKRAIQQIRGHSALANPSARFARRAA